MNELFNDIRDIVISWMVPHIERAARLGCTWHGDSNADDLYWYYGGNSSRTTDCIGMWLCDNGERIPLMDLTCESTLRSFDTAVLPKGSIVKFSYIDTRFDDEDDYIEVTDQIGFVRVSSIHCIEIMYKEGIDVTKISVTPGDLFGGEYEDKDSRVELNIEILDVESMLKENDENEK